MTAERGVAAVDVVGAVAGVALSVGVVTMSVGEMRLM